MIEDTNLIGEIDFKDIKVSVYHNASISKETFETAWRMRNPDSAYTGIMYVNMETGKISYPDNAIIPEQTESDREILPKFIVTGLNEINDYFISLIMPYLERIYKSRNNIVI